MATVNVRYKPAMTSADLPAGSTHAAMDAFLLSDQLAEPVMAAARAIAADARGIASVERVESSEYMNSIEAERTTPMVINGYPRITGAVTAHGGTYRPGTEATSPDTSVAAIVEFGNAKAPAAHILARAGMPYDSPKVPL